MRSAFALFCFFALSLTAHAGICDWLFKSKIGRLIPYIKQESLETFRKLGTGAEIEFIYNGKTLRGKISKLNYEQMVVDGKTYKLNRVESPEILRMSETKLERVIDLHRKDYLNFLEQDYWQSITNNFKEELLTFKNLTKVEQEDYLRNLGSDIVEKIKAKKGTDNVGFHYNLHGGVAADYVNSYGIIASQGDITLNYSMHGDPNYKVYFFQSKEINLFDVLNQAHPNLYSARMGNIFNIFDLNSSYLRHAMSERGASNMTSIFIDFKPEWLARQPLANYADPNVAIPYSTYLAPPMELFSKTSKNLGIEEKLSRHEETLATMRYIEHVVLNTDWVKKVD